MKENNIKSKTVKRYKVTTNSNHTLTVSPNLLNQNFKVDAPGRHGALILPMFGLHKDGFIL